jgi:hypothetical protein
MKHEFSRKILEKPSNIKFHENPSSGSQSFHADRQTDRQTDMTKRIVAFRNFANAPKDATMMLSILASWKNKL